MMLPRFRFLAACFLPVAFAASLFGASSSAVPSWLQEAVRCPTPPVATGAPAVVLLDETAYKVQPTGRVVVEHRYAVRVLDRSGSNYAVGRVYFLDKREPVRSTNAWLLRVGKALRLPSRRAWVDVSDAASGAIYDERRCRVVSYSDIALIEDVFAFETVVEADLLFAQLAQNWSSPLPRVVDRVRLELPTGWSYDAVVDGLLAESERAAVQVRPGWWELRDLPYHPPEPAVPDSATVDARLLLNLQPGAGYRGDPIPQFDGWGQVADWDLRNSHGQCDTDAALAQTAHFLAAGCPDGLSRIRALASHVQRLRYAGVNQGIAEGMGYRPRKATVVNAKGWGDCKDKANLLCALLREVGIEAYSVNARIGGRDLFNEAWPSLMQFNHAIAAIRVDDSVDLPAVLAVPGLGRLLFFDPTAPNVVAGDLPWQLQGTTVHVLALGNSTLTRLPILDAATSHRVERTVALRINGSGVEGKCTISGAGRTGSARREALRTKTSKDLRLMLAGIVNETVRGAVVSAESADDDPVSGDCRYSFEFAAPRYGQALPGGLLLVRLDVLSRDTIPSFSTRERTLPVELPPVCQQDQVELTLPAGWVVDEAPLAAKVESEFGEYECSYEVLGDKVIARRRFQSPYLHVPVADYARLRGFLAEVAKAERAALVLRVGTPGATEH